MNTVRLNPLDAAWVFTEARGVNAAGLVVGSVTERLQRGTKYHAWLWRVEQQGGSWVATSLGELPWDSKALHQRALDVNDAGVVAGYVRDNGNEYAALWSPDASGGYPHPPRVRWVPEWNATHVNRCGWRVSSMMSGRGPPTKSPASATAS